MDGKGKLDRHIIFESVSMLITKNDQNQSVLVETQSFRVFY